MSDPVVRPPAPLYLALGLAACAGHAPPAATPVGPAASPAVEVVEEVTVDGVAATPAGEREVDRGELVLRARGRRAGSEQFTIVRAGDELIVRSEVRLESGATLRLLDSELVTDLGWRPRRAHGRDVKDGVTITTLAGAPLVLTSAARLGATTIRTASRPVDLFLADDTFAHFAPACALAAPAVLTGFPGMEVHLGADRATARPGVSRRSLDLAGTLRAVVTCEDGRLLAVELPAQAMVAVRREREAELAPLLLPTPAKAPLPGPLTETERTLVVGDVTLACSLIVPDGDARVPAAVLLTGSGAQDRDEDSPGPGGIKLGLLRALAHELGRGGVASLRCDDRGVGGSTGTVGAATLATLVSDARAMADLLAREPRVDPARRVMLGHSEGAVVALAVAAADPRLAGAVSLAGPARPLDEVLLEQVARTLARAGLTVDEATAALDRHRAAFAAVRAGTPLPDTAEAREWAGGEAWLRSHLTHDVLVDVAALGERPLLVVQGGVDRQVGEVDAERLVAAARAAGNPAVVERRYPGLDHLLAPSETGEPAAYLDPDRRVDAQVLIDVRAFVAAVPPTRAPARVARAHR